MVTRSMAGQNTQRATNTPAVEMTAEVEFNEMALLLHLLGNEPHRFGRNLTVRLASTVDTTLSLENAEFVLRITTLAPS